MREVRRGCCVDRLNSPFESCPIRPTRLAKLPCLRRYEANVGVRSLATPETSLKTIERSTLEDVTDVLRLAVRRVELAGPARDPLELIAHPLQLADLDVDIGSAILDQ